MHVYWTDFSLLDSSFFVFVYQGWSKIGILADTDSRCLSYSADNDLSQYTVEKKKDLFWEKIINKSNCNICQNRLFKNIYTIPFKSFGKLILLFSKDALNGSNVTVNFFYNVTKDFCLK